MLYICYSIFVNLLILGSFLLYMYNLPSLNFSLFIRCAEIVCRSVEIIGALSLMSLELNEMISLDGEIVKGLILLLGSTKRKISMAACNAILDLSTTAAGQQRLLELSAMDKLM